MNKPTGIMRFYWLRHAPPINPDNLCYGQADIRADISDDAAFARQANRLPEDAKWVSSPLIRTMDTAEKLAAFRENGKTITIRPDRALIEQSFGRWEKMTRTDMRNDPGFPAYNNDPANVAPPGGESLIDLAGRVTPAIEKLIHDHPEGGNVVVVAHGGTIRAALHQATGLPMRDTLRLGVSPLSLTIIQYDPRKLKHGKNPWSLESLNIRP
jgi:alpha-ribazole phosphatase